MAGVEAISVTGTGRRAGLAVVLAADMASSTYVQFIFGVLASFIIDEFGISRSQLGLLTTAAFIAGGLLSPGAGRFVDRTGARRVMVGSLVLMAVATIAMAASPTYIWLLGAAVFSGVALACCNPTTNQIIARAVPVGGRGVVMGFKQAGVQIGAFFTGAVAPLVAQASGWRVAMAGMVLWPVATIAGTYAVVPPDDASYGATEQTSAALGPTVWWMAAYAFLMGAGVAVVSTYLPLFARDEAGYSVGHAGALAAVIGAIGILSRIAWGRESERRGMVALPLTIMAIGAALATVMTLISPSAPWLLWPVALLMGATAISWNAIAMLAIVAEFGTERSGRASGYVQSAFYSGFVVYPVLFGYTVDATGEWVVGWTVVTATFCIAALVSVLWHRRARLE
jgi:predicted MFS family arabinose efflux permease